MRINGTIDFLELDELKELLRKLFIGSEVRHKVRIFGDDFEIINQKYEIYVSTFDPTNKNPMKKPRFSIEGYLKFNLQESILEFERIINLLKVNNNIFCLAYYPNENDDAEEVESMSMKYWEVYEQMKIK